MDHNYYVYILSSRTRTIYTGVTNDLERRLYEHQHKIGSQFTRKYGVTTLVYYEHTTHIEGAIAREKQIKGWTRAKKIALIEGMNPDWKDLSLEWQETADRPVRDPSLRSG